MNWNQCNLDNLIIQSVIYNNPCRSFSNAAGNHLGNFLCGDAPHRPLTKSDLSWSPGKACCRLSTRPVCNDKFSCSHLCFPKCGRHRFQNTSPLRLAYSSNAMGCLPPFQGSYWENRKGRKSSMCTPCYWYMILWFRPWCCLLGRSKTHGFGSTARATFSHIQGVFVEMLTKA